MSKYQLERELELEEKPGQYSRSSSSSRYFSRSH
jgi:hypothetical protein